jgi:hypothetical protein
MKDAQNVVHLTLLPSCDDLKHWGMANTDIFEQSALVIDQPSVPMSKGGVRTTSEYRFKSQNDVVLATGGEEDVTSLKKAYTTRAFTLDDRYDVTIRTRQDREPFRTFAVAIAIVVDLSLREAVGRF